MQESVSGPIASVACVTQERPRELECRYGMMIDSWGLSLMTKEKGGNRPSLRFYIQCQDASLAVGLAQGPIRELDISLVVVALNQAQGRQWSRQARSAKTLQWRWRGVIANGWTIEACSAATAMIFDYFL